MSKYKKGRGSQNYIPNRFFEFIHEELDEFKEYRFRESEDTKIKTRFINIFPKTIVNKVISPDVGMQYSLNPYQGCEHGCIYCYARNSHEYWGYGAGLDFESTILVKKNAPDLLDNFLNKKSWKATTIVLSGNTDCYQPIEKKLKITRSLLEVFKEYKHPVAVITKNALIKRDMDIITGLAKNNLFRLIISINTLSEQTKGLVEPRTASINKRLKTIEIFSRAGIPVSVMIAPIIPGINSHEVLKIAKITSEKGAISMGHTVVRLNGSIGNIFENWIYKAYPERALKVLNLIKSCHNGKLNDSNFGKRMRGEGNVAKQINDMVKLARKKYFTQAIDVKLNTTSFTKPCENQLRLFK